MTQPGEAVVFDLEFTTWEGAQARRWSGPGEFREIVQIGAVRLDRDLSEVGTFSLLVKPRFNPVLSAYFVDLTGITQAEVDAEGVDLAVAIAQFATFAEGACLVSNGIDGDVLADNCALRGLAFPFEGRCANLSERIRSALDSPRHVVSSRLPGLIGVPAAGREHDALADARAVAAALRWMTQAR